MGYLYNCECSWMNRDHKTFYIRKTEKIDGKTKAKWIPLGVTCLGCKKVNFIGCLTPIKAEEWRPGDVSFDGIGGSKTSRPCSGHTKLPPMPCRFD